MGTGSEECVATRSKDLVGAAAEDEAIALKTEVW